MITVIIPVFLVITAFRHKISHFDPVIILLGEHTHPSHPLVMFYEDLHHNVLKLDIHDGGHRLLLWAEQSGPEDHAQVGHRHQVVLIVTGHAVGRRERCASSRRLKFYVNNESK